MVKKFLSMTVALGIALGASTALAGTYVSGELPPEFGAGFIPPNPKVLANVQKASKTGAKLAASVEKCYSKGAANYSKNKAGAAAGVTTCLTDTAKGVIPKYEKAITKIGAKAPGLPPCHNYVADGNVIASLVKGFNGLTYCQSPSGAFVDGTASF